MENKFSRVVDALPSQVWIALPDGKIDFVNGRWCEYTGIRAEEARQLSWKSILHPEDLRRFLNAWRSILASGKPAEIEARLRRFDGEHRWFRIAVSPMFNDEAQIVQWLAINTEIEDRKQAEQAPRIDEINFRHMIDNVPGFVGTLNPAGEVEFVNRQLLEYFGLTAEQLSTWRSGHVVHPDDLPRAISGFSHALATGTCFVDEQRYRRSDGEYRWFHVRVSPVRNAEGRITRWYTFSHDVHDRKLAEDALRASEDNFRKIVDSIPGLVTTLSSSGEIELVNKRVLEYYGRTIEEIRAWATDDLIHPDDRSRSVGIFLNAIKDGIPHEVELRCRRADGVYRWFQLAALPVRDTAGIITGWYVLMTDIDDRKHAEEELRISESNLRQILDSIPGLVGSLSPAGDVELVNRQSLDYFGLTLQQLANWRTIDIIHPDDMPRVVTNLRDALTTGDSIIYEIRYRRADGEYRWFQVCISPVRDTGGHINRWYTFSIDIHDRKCAEEELRRSEAFLAQGQCLNLTGTFAWNLRTDKITFTEQLYRIFELDPNGPLTFEQIRARVHSDDIPLFTEKMALVRKDISDHDYGIRLRMPDGRIKYLRTKSYGIRHLDGSLEHIGAIQDVTEQRLAEEALNELRAELAHMARVTSLGALAASIAHEVNQPLAAIVTNGMVCLRTLSAEHPNIEGAREAAQRLIRDGKRASAVITRLRTLFGKKEATIEPVDLNEATREVVALSLSELQRNRVILRQELAESLPSVRADRVQIQQVILNLLRNASDAMRGVDDRPRELIIRTGIGEDYCVCLTVEDMGVGISMQDPEKLFEAFYTTKSDGMGMGLSVSRAIIESHNGRLWAAPNDGTGATFSFSLPGIPDRLADSQNLDSTKAPVQEAAVQSRDPRETQCVGNIGCV